jgi:hypothetical protein
MFHASPRASPASKRQSDMRLMMEKIAKYGTLSGIPEEHSETSDSATATTATTEITQSTTTDYENDDTPIDLTALLKRIRETQTTIEDDIIRFEEEKSYLFDEIYETLADTPETNNIPPEKYEAIANLPREILEEKLQTFRYISDPEDFIPGTYCRVFDPHTFRLLPGSFFVQWKPEQQKVYFSMNNKLWQFRWNYGGRLFFQRYLDTYYLAAKKLAQDSDIVEEIIDNVRTNITAEYSEDYSSITDRH